MITAKNMAAQLRLHQYEGPNEEHVHQLITWLDMQGDVFLGSDITLYLQNLQSEMYYDLEIKSVDYKPGPEDLDKVTTQDDLDDAKEAKEFNSTERQLAALANPEPEDPDEDPVLDVVTDDGRKSHDDDELTGSGVTRAVPEGDFVGALEAGWTHEKMATRYREGAELLDQIRTAGNTAKQRDHEELTKILQDWKSVGMSQREIVKKLKGTISQRTVGRILRGEWLVKRG